ncbi:MAG TPA: signal peptidase I [Candidatus Nanopelagicales bacterium]
MSTAAAQPTGLPAPTSDTDPYPLALFVAGLVSRTWLWFVGGCILITLVPILFGWRPFVVQSGSMEPRIRVGDVVLAAPVASADELLGRVAVFTDPERPDTAKTHRVVAQNADGSLTTKGDANPTADSMTVPFSAVRGLGRLLVSHAGLPLVWVGSGQWPFLLLFLLSLVGAAVVASRDHEEPDDDVDSKGPDGGKVLPFPTSAGPSGATAVAAATPLDPGLRRTALLRPLLGHRAVLKFAYVAVLAVALVVPTTTSATYTASTKNRTDSWAADNPSYGTAVTGLNPLLYWKLDETAGTTAVDSSGNGHAGTYTNAGVASTTGFTRGITGALVTETPNLGITLSGASTCVNGADATALTAPVQTTEIVWFKTTTTQGGKLLGFENPRTGVGIPGSGGTYDRHIYLDGSGKVWFGVYNGGYVTLTSPTALNDGAWHMAAATLGSTGMSLWIDGTQVATNTNTAGEATVGWFRAGCGNLGGWGGSWTGPNNPTTSTNPTQNRPFAGSLDEVSIWQSVLTTAQIRALWFAH